MDADDGERFFMGEIDGTRRRYRRRIGGKTAAMIRLEDECAWPAAI